jgi:hypothetical protein
MSSVTPRKHAQALEDRIARYREGAERGAAWLAERVGPDGTYGPEADDIAFYYKGPYALTLTGRFVEAARMLDHVKRVFLGEDGDFGGSDAKSSNDFLGRWYYTYANVWLVMGAHMMGRFDVSYPGLEFILRFRDTDSGGFFSERPADDGGSRIDSLTTSFNGRACLYLGRRDEALAAGDFLLRFLELQPEDGRFYSSYVPEKGLVTSPGEGEEALHYVVDSAQERQWYFFVGHPAGYLSELYALTGDDRYRRGAESYFAFAVSCREDVYAHPPSGKLGWGSAASFRATRDVAFRDAAERIADYLLSIQNPDGSWLYDSLYGNMDEQPAAITFDLTHEFVTWLAEIAGDLAAAEA